jgi:hypothetical protein
VIVPGPDLPPPHELIGGDVWEYRWPMAAEKVELDNGCPYFYGFFDQRDVEIAERAFPGRRAVIDPHENGEPGVGNLKLLPGDRLLTLSCRLRAECERARPAW